MVLQSFSVASPGWACPLPRLPPGQMSESSAPLDQAVGHRFLAQSHSPLPQVTAGRGRTSCSASGGEGSVLEMGGSPSSFPGHTAQPWSCSPPKVLPENKGPLRFTAGCMVQTPPLALTSTPGPHPQIQIRAHFPGWCNRVIALPGMVRSESPRWTTSPLISITRRYVASPWL